ncbi:MAG TPA: glycosyltransferase family A protein [Thermoanaerobaculia bacterium]
MRTIALIAARNEERVLAAALDNFVRQDISFYLIDNDSTDATVAIAERYHDRGLVGIERMPRGETYEWERILRRKEELAQLLDADWFIHADADEIRLPSRSDETLASALERADRDGFNAANFLEFSFMPTRESPTHEHPHFQETMLWYYPFAPQFPHRLTAWKKQQSRVDLAASGGHLVAFEGLKIFPETLRMRHYLCLSVPHAIEKWVNRRFADDEVAKGWHGWRAKMTADAIELPSEKELRRYISDDALDPSGPRSHHFMQDAYEAWVARTPSPADQRDS